MLPKSERIKYNGLFQQAYEKGKKYNGKLLRVIATETRASFKDRLPYVGFVISKNYSKKAVLRNKLKRQLSEIYRLYRAQKDKHPSLYKVGLLVVAVKGSYQKDKYNYDDLEKDLNDLLNKI